MFTILIDIPSDQYERFILNTMQSLAGIGLLINVIDAFDECERRKAVLDVLSKGVFPDNIRFIITTRAEKDIMASLKDQQHVLALDLNELGADVIKDDIKLYVHHRLDCHLFGDEQIEQFVVKANGLFQWAATACNYICNDDDDQEAGRDPQECFDLILSKSSNLDTLYHTILESVFPRADSQVQSVKSVLAKVLAAAEPLSTPLLKALSIGKAEERAIYTVLPYLGSVLTVSSQSIRPIHTSFRDFLTKSDRSGKFWVDIKSGHQALAEASFQVMRTELCFNKCNIESSYHTNTDLTQEQINHISPALFYSCRFWADHIKEITVIGDGIQNALSYLMCKQLLFWLEVLSIKQALDFAWSALENIVHEKGGINFIILYC
jgi:hypothetical protein